MKLPPSSRFPVVLLERRHGAPGPDPHPLGGPLVDVVDDGKAWRLVFELPGAVPDKLSLEIHGRVVTLRGERRPTDGEKGRFLRVERVAGPFERSLELPDDPDAEGTSASYSDGLLTVEIPRRAATKSRTIQIRKGPASRGS